MKILITGAGSGIGKDVAIALAKRNHHVIAGCHGQKQVNDLADQNLDQLEPMLLDITNDDHRIHAAELEPDILVNNAGVAESGPMAEIPMEYVRRNFETNVFATLELTQQCVKHMLKNKNGRIITVTSVAGKIALPYLGTYTMTKFALEAMGDNLRQELAHHNIHASLIEPGAIRTGFNEKMNASKYKWFSKKSLFWTDAKRIKKFENLLISDQKSKESIVKAIVHACESKRPKTRYARPVRYALMIKLAMLAPDRLRDRIIAR
jgi:short-subunit dehydrogenase